MSAPNCPPLAPEFAHRPDDAHVRDVQIALSDLQLGVPEQQLDLTDVEAVLKLYPEQSKLDALVKQDEEKFMNAMEQLLGKPQTIEPFKPVSNQFLDLPLSLTQRLRCSSLPGRPGR